MKISFEDRSYIEMVKSAEPGKICIAVAAKSADNAKQLIVNCVELTEEQLLNLLQSVR